MRLDGLFFMLISWTVILGLFGYSMVRILFRKHHDQCDKEALSQDEAGDNP